MAAVASGAYPKPRGPAPVDFPCWDSLRGVWTSEMGGEGDERPRQTLQLKNKQRSERRRRKRLEQRVAADAPLARTRGRPADPAGKQQRQAMHDLSNNMILRLSGLGLQLQRLCMHGLLQQASLARCVGKGGSINSRHMSERSYSYMVGPRRSFGGTVSPVLQGQVLDAGPLILISVLWTGQLVLHTRELRWQKLKRQRWQWK
jgi:hypothetical protein